MAYHDDLLTQAWDLLHRNEPHSTQADLRRAVSTAYYVQNLKTVAQAFVQLQEKRHVADYHNGIRWTHTESLLEVTTVSKAFLNWTSIRNENIAQDCLVSLLIKLRE